MIQLYFAANKWWSPPRLPFQTGEGGEDEDEDGGVWDCPFPDVTE